MTLPSNFAQNWRGGLTGFALTLVIGLLLWLSPAGRPFAHLSFDILSLGLPHRDTRDLLIIELDDQAHEMFGVEYGTRWPRDKHAELLDRLTLDHAKLVLLDITLVEPGDPAENESLANAILRNGNVVLAADLIPASHPGLAGSHVKKPRPELLAHAAAWGLSTLVRDSDGFIRRHYPGTEKDPALSWAAAAFLNAPVTQARNARQQPLWIHYYGPARSTFNRISYALALSQPPGFYANKIILIGGRPNTVYDGEVVDEFPGPFTRWNRVYYGGVEIIATLVTNLWLNDGLHLLPWGWHLSLLVLSSLLFGFGFRMFRPLPAAGLALLGILLAFGTALAVLWLHQSWFDWMIIAAAQIPCAWTWSVVSQFKRVSRETEIYRRALEETARQLTPLEPRSAASTGTPSGPDIPDHVLLRRVGRGAYGEVWLARNAIGTYDAVKIIYRDSFSSETPYLREFNGIKKFMPISRGHLGWAPILHVGKNDRAGYFFYTMEVADDQSNGTTILPDTYSPRTLASDIHLRKALPAAECLPLFLSLTAALHYLHEHGLIHRDIKPSNILFVHGAPKLADIGLVTDRATSGREVTMIGTMGYIPPEGPGKPTADVFSLGIVFYQALTGLEASLFPELPSGSMERPDALMFMELNKIIGKACMTELEWRYQSAQAMHKDLQELQQRLRGST